MILTLCLFAFMAGAAPVFYVACSANRLETEIGD